MTKIADFPVLLKQYSDGLISWSEFLLAVQLPPAQLELLTVANQLPFKAFHKLRPEDFVDF